jgi:hypothetical protein
VERRASLDKELFDAVAKGDINRVRELLRKGASVNARSWGRLTPLYYAVTLGYADVARILIEHGADVNAMDKYGNTPLHAAASLGYAEIARLLLKHGADPGIRDKDGKTPLDIAREKGHEGVVRVIEKYNRKQASQSSPFLTYQEWENAKKAGKLDDLIGKRVKSRTIEGEIIEIDTTPVRYGLEPSIVIKTKEGEELSYSLSDFEKKFLTRASARKHVSASPSIIAVECPELRVGEWGRLLVRVSGSGSVFVSLEGDVEWINPGVLELSGEGVVEVPVRSKTSGELPVRVVVKSSGSESSKIVWLKVAEKTARCPSCGAPIEPGAKYCWNCGARLA